MTESPAAAMIFAAGFGTRMGAATKTTPKPMLPFNGRPMIDHAVDLAKAAGVTRIVSNTHYLPDRLEAHLADLGVQTLREEPDILDTGGGLKAARTLLASDPVFTLNPDSAWSGPNPLTLLRKAWRPEMRALLLLVPCEVAGRPDNTGDFDLIDGTLKRKGPFLYTGAQILRTEGLDAIREPVFSLNRYWDHLAEGGPIHGCIYPGLWRDIGTADGLEKIDTEGWPDV